MEMPPNWRLINCDRSAARRIAPARLKESSILDDRRDGRVAAVIVKHLDLPGFVVLRVVLDERDLILIVVVPSSLAVRTAGFYIHDYGHLNLPTMLLS